MGGPPFLPVFVVVVAVVSPFSTSLTCIKMRPDVMLKISPYLGYLTTSRLVHVKFAINF